MPHLWLSSCLFSHHLFHSTANTMTYYVFQLDSPWCLRSNSLAACELLSRLSIFHHDSWRISSKCLAECQKQAGGTWREKRLLWILILIFRLFTFINKMLMKRNICSFWTPPEMFLMREYWLRSYYIIFTWRAKSFHALSCARSV